MSAMSGTICSTCMHKEVCKYIDDVLRLTKETGGSFSMCRFHSMQLMPHMEEHKEEKEAPKPALGKCERCGKTAYKLYECETCHKKVCSNCAEIEQELNINTGGFEESVHCLDCAEED